MNPSELREQKLIWLVNQVANPHYGCEYKQDNTPRASVRCGGCLHSSESKKRAVQDVVDYVRTLTARDAEREAAIRIDEGKYWENNIMPEFRSWQTSEKMSNRYKALEAIKRKEEV